MKIKTSELTGAALDWAVATCEGLIDCSTNEFIFTAPSSPRRYSPSTDGWFGIRIIERERIDVLLECSASGWVAYGNNCIEDIRDASYGEGETPLIAAMRCYVASKLGDEVDIPEEWV